MDSGGKGNATIRTVSALEASVIRQEGYLVIIAPVAELEVDGWKYPNGDDFCIIRDPGEWVDDWLYTSVKEDVQRAAAN